MSPLPSPRHRPSATSPRKRIEGQVRWFDQIRGVGLASTDTDPRQVHLHYRELDEGAYRALDAGDRITFWVEATDDGPVAREIAVVASLPRE